jgi:hypothetical protein
MPVEVQIERSIHFRFPPIQDITHLTMATEQDKTPEARTVEGTRIKWDDSNMRSAYANVCHVSSTREEVVLLFGLNQAWNRGQKEVTIQLTERIIVSPYAAKRLASVLASAVSEYENRFGVLSADVAPAQAAGATMRPKK